MELVRQKPTSVAKHAERLVRSKHILLERMLQRIVTKAPSILKDIHRRSAVMQIHYFRDGNVAIQWAKRIIFQTSDSHATYLKDWFIGVESWQCHQNALSRSLHGKAVLDNDILEITRGSEKGKVVRAMRDSHEDEDFVRINIGRVVNKKALRRVNKGYPRAQGIALAVQAIVDWNKSAPISKKVSILNGKPKILVGVGDDKTFECYQKDLDREELTGKLCNKYSN